MARAFGVLEGSNEPEPDPIPKNYLIGQSATFPRSYQRRKYPWRTTKEKSDQLGSRGIHKIQPPKQTQGTKRDTALINGRGSSSSDTLDALTCETPDEDGTSEIDNTRRRRLTPDETEYLLRKFHQMEKPSAKDRLRFADELKLTPRTIQIWFQNRRAKLKKETRLVRELHSKELPEEGDSSGEELDTNCVAQDVTAMSKDLNMAEKEHRAAEGTNGGVAAAYVDPPMPQLQPVNDPLSQMYCTDWNGVCSDEGNAPFFSLTTTPSFETMLSQQVAVDVGLLQGIDNDIGSNTCSYDPRPDSSASFCGAQGLDGTHLSASDDWQLQTLFESEPRYIFEESFPFSSPSHSAVSTSGVSEEQTSSTSDERKADRAPEPQAPIQEPSRGQRSTVPGPPLSRIKNPVPRHQRALTLVEIDS
ncbi:hypothetical protein EMPS_00160 [Entomortierella parvispora]|uniref:Homeobox domain-containing protein n=1 Tax=Entomortierella parvispora TaxID=205924 RepID=A0A9P3GZJ9_9FUNG|nr:hypothetical protein EMPS_00160 [Entomortierella parvispora]